jgi:hypothetical protein
MIPSWNELLPYVLLVGLAALLSKMLSTIRAKNKSGVLPPCLPWLPVVGSLPFIGKLENITDQFTKESKKRGAVFAFYAGNKLVRKYFFLD